MNFSSTPRVRVRMTAGRGGLQPHSRQRHWRQFSERLAVIWDTGYFM